MASAIVRMVPELKAKGYIQLFKSDEPSRFADGEQKRDFIYVQDAASMTCSFLDNTAAGIFNIGTGKASSWNDLAKAVCTALGKAPSISYVDMPADLKGKYQSFTEADIQKTAQTLGAQFRITPIEQAVHEYVQHFLVKDARW
jgi:ADP-L-glycero-D-manno-heptose 6-epimerase